MLLCVASAKRIRFSETAAPCFSKRNTEQTTNLCNFLQMDTMWEYCVLESHYTSSLYFRSRWLKMQNRTVSSYYSSNLVVHLFDSYEGQPGYAMLNLGCCERFKGRHSGSKVVQLSSNSPYVSLLWVTYTVVDLFSARGWYAWQIHFCLQMQPHILRQTALIHVHFCVVND